MDRLSIKIFMNLLAILKNGLDNNPKKLYELQIWTKVFLKPSN